MSVVRFVILDVLTKPTKTLTEWPNMVTPFHHYKFLVFIAIIQLNKYF